MTLTVKHGFVSQIADNPNAAALGEILPQSHWNATHVVTGTLDPSQLPNNVVSFNASGSIQATTGTISAGSTTLSLGAAQDFQNNQGIAIFGAGAVTTVQSPTGLTLNIVGTAGSTSHTYQIAPVDALAGVGPAIAGVTIATANATLDLNNYVALTWTKPASGPTPAAYAVYRDGVFITLAATTAHNDQGVSRSRPSWCPAAPPGAASSSMLVTTISSGAGTTSLTLAAAASTTVSSAVVQHDDTTAVINSFTAAMGGNRLNVPDGTYLISSSPNTSMTGNLDIFCTQGATFKAQSNLATPILQFEDFGGTDRFSLAWRGGTFDNSGGIFGLATSSDSCLGLTRVGPFLIDGVIFQGAATQALAGISSDSGIQFTTSINSIITNCRFFGQGDTAIYATGGASTGGADDGGGIVISGNVFTNCGSAVSVKRQMPRVIISNNYVDTCFSGFSLFEADSGIVIDPGRQCLISNNIIRKCTSTPICIHTGAVDTADGSGTGLTAGSRTQMNNNTILDWGYLSDGVTPYNGSGAFGSTTAAITIQGASQCRIADSIIALEDWGGAPTGGNGNAATKGIYITQFILNSVTYNPDTVEIDGVKFINVKNAIVEDASATGVGPTMAWGCSFTNVNTDITTTANNATKSIHEEWDFINGLLKLFVGTTETTTIESDGTKSIGFRTFLDATPITRIKRASSTLNFGAVSANSTSDLTITATGLTINNGVCWVTPQASNLVPSGISYFAFVSATNTVTVRAINSTTGSITLPSGTYVVCGMLIG